MAASTINPSLPLTGAAAETQREQWGPILNDALTEIVGGVNANVDALGTKVAKGDIVLNVKDYGAKGDGVTDDTAAIQAAIDAGTAAGGATVLMPPAVYAIGGQIEYASSVHLSAKGATVKLLPSSTMRALLLQDVSNCSIDGLTIDLNKSQTTNGADENNQQGIYVSVSTSDVENIAITNVQVLNGWQDGISASATTGLSMAGLTIDGCTVSSVGGAGICARGHGNTDRTTPSLSQRVAIRGCTVTNPGGVGIQAIGLSDVAITDNVLDGGGVSTSHGICFSTAGTDGQVTDFTCSGNKVRGFTAAARWGIVVSNNCRRFAVNDNIVTGCAGGISIDPDDGVTGLIDVSATLKGNSVRDSVSTHGINARVCKNLTIGSNTSCNNALGNGIALSNAYGCTVGSNTCNSNKTGIGITGVNAGTGGHSVGVNTTLGNTTAAVSSSATPVSCLFATTSTTPPA